MILKILTILLLTVSHYLAKGIMKIETDKSNYFYGDSIEVKVTIVNNSDTSFSIWGSTTCIVRIGFNSVPFQIDCTTDFSEFPFPPNSSRTWIWRLIPSKLGIPDKNGEQMIYAFGAGLEDSILITAPKFFGGRIVVGFKLGTSAQEIQQLRDSLNATILWGPFTSVSAIIEEWQISNFSVDSLVSVYLNDYRLEFIEVNRPLQFNDVIVTSVKSIDTIPEKYFLYQNYPNPFNPNTVISYTIPSVETGYIPSLLRVYDVLGREVATLVDEEQKSGSYNVQFDASSLSSGIYFYTIIAGSFHQTKKMVLLK